MNDGASGENDGSETGADSESRQRKRKGESPEMIESRKTEEKVCDTDDCPVSSCLSPEPRQRRKGENVIVPLHVRNSGEREEDKKIEEDLFLPVFFEPHEKDEVKNTQGEAEKSSDSEDGGNGQSVGRGPPDIMEPVNGQTGDIECLGA